jgi:hypothetical protein
MRKPGGWVAVLASTILTTRRITQVPRLLLTRNRVPVGLFVKGATNKLTME